MRRVGLTFCWVLSLLLCLSTTPAFADGYAYSRTVTIDHTKVPNTDQSNFPVLFSGTYSYLKTTANGGNVTNASGYDIIFSSSSSCATKLDHEIETYTASTGAVNLWVRVPTVSHTTDTVLYLCYGNSAITTSQENKTGVWDTNFKGVWHLPNGSTLTANDSTSNVVNGTVNGASATTGEMDGAASFTGTNNIDLGTGGGVGAGSDWTASAWIYPASSPGGGMIVVKRDSFSVGGNQFVLGLGSDGGSVRLNAGFNANYANFTTTPSLNTWQYVVVVGNASGVTMYKNASGTNSTAGGNYSTTSNWQSGSGTGQKLAIGRLITEASDTFPGYIDEVRISNIARSADWISSEYNNQNSPSTFYTVGAEVASTSPNYFRRRVQ